MNILGIALSFACLLFAVVVGSKKKINIGLMALPFAYFFLVFFQDVSGSTILTYWPVSICGQLIAVMFFYGFVVSAGVMDWISQYVLRILKRAPVLLPFVAAFLPFFITACGIFPTMVIPLTYPILFAVADKLQYSKGKIIIWGTIGSWIGSWTPAAMGLAITKMYTKMFMTGISDELAAASVQQGITANLIVSLVAFVIYYLIWRGWKVPIPEGVDLDEVFAKPAPLDRKQKPVFIVFAVAVFMLFIPKILGNITGWAWLAWFAGKLDLTGVFFTGGIVLALLNPEETGEVIKKLPWGLCLMLFGVTALFKAMEGFGLLTLLASIFNLQFPTVMAVVVVFLISGLLTMVSDGLAVVVPMLLPIVWTLNSAIGLPVGLGVNAVMTGSSVPGMFPVSSGGAITLSIIPEEERSAMSKQLIRLAFMQLAFYGVGYLVAAFVLC